MNYLLGLLVALQAADGGITWYGLHHGAEEANPVAAAVLSTTDVCLGILAIKLIGVAALLWMFTRPHVFRNPMTAKVLTLIVTGYGWVVYHNLTIIGA